jgi:O-antigen/teichoic acid export membrane protein
MKLEDLKQRTVRGGFAKLGGQAASFVIRLAFIVVLSRLLDPHDFGLVAMVTVVTGVFKLFGDAGLSAATIQNAVITDGQISTLFWVNMLVGTILALLCVAAAPLIVRFYNEPQLFWLTVTMGAGFILNAAGVQHAALLARHMRYVAVTVIETLSLVVSIAVGIGMALKGFSYWALVGAAIAAPAANSAGMWITAGWIPGMPSRDTKIGSMLRFGSTLTLNSLITYIAYNMDKILLGRFWGAVSLGIYGRAYQLINVPTDNLNSAVGGVMFAALSRLQDDPARYKNYFLKGYSLVNSLTLPTTIFCALFANDIVLVALGPKWIEATPIFRLLTPTVLIFGMINPMSWLLYSMGLQRRSLMIALVIAPLAIGGYLIGLPYGPHGVAFAFSAAMTLWLVPHIIWCLHGTIILPVELFIGIGRPFFSALVAGAFAFSVQYFFADWQTPLLRLIAESGIMLFFYVLMLLFVMQQKNFYLALLRELKGSSSADV